MKITALLAFWDEPAARLYRCVKSAGLLADHIVAADGPFALFPHTKTVSNSVALGAVKAGAEDGGITFELLKGREWPGQVAKRDAMMKAAAGSDWVFWMDADDVLVECDREGVRKELAETDADALKAERYTPVNPDARWSPDSNGDECQGATTSQPRLFRYLDDMRVEYAHWVYTGALNGKRVTLWGPRDQRIHQHHIPPPCHTKQIAALLLFEHHQTWRSDTYRRRQLAYREATAKQVRETGAEA